MTELIRATATEIVRLLKAGTVSPLDCLDALEARIGAVDSKVKRAAGPCASSVQGA
ncbi:MAG: amidase, partial [Rhizobiales bacterium]|nr:amidase [Hyphomicrobiales bacterium]